MSTPLPDGALRGRPNPARVLVVDDEPIVAGLVQDVLRQHGVAADVSAGGEPGLEQAACGDYDLVISDFAMPELNGLEFARRLRARSGRGRVIIVSALLDPDVRTALEAEPSVVALLRKPFDIFELVRQVDRVLLPPPDDRRTLDAAAAS